MKRSRFASERPAAERDHSSDEVHGALNTLTFAVALVMDAAGRRGAELHVTAGRAATALADALLFAAGDPAHELWATAFRSVAVFVEKAESGTLAFGSRDALASLKGFLSENADLSIRL